MQPILAGVRNEGLQGEVRTISYVSRITVLADECIDPCSIASYVLWCPVAASSHSRIFHIVPLENRGLHQGTSDKVKT